MTIEQYDVDDIKIQSKYLDLRLRPDSMVVTRLFSENLNLPFVAFTVEDGNIVLSPPTKIRVKDNTVYFDAEKLSGSVSVKADSLLLQAQSYGARIGFMWPNSRSGCYLADGIRPINKDFTTVGKFKTPGDDPSFINMSIPAIHMVDKTCMIVHSQLQEPIEFCFFYHNLLPYWNAITNDMLQLAFRPCSSRRDGLSVYYARCGNPKQSDIASGHLGVEQMKRCLYNNVKVAPSDNEISLKQPKQLQGALDEYKIKNCIIGSLAMHLHGFPIETRDFDIAVDSLEKVRTFTQEVLKEDLEVSESQKWSRCGARLTLKEGHVDFVELSRFDWDQVEKIQGVKVLSTSGLLLMKLAGEYERHQIEPNYDNFKLKNYANIDLLLQKSPFVYPFFDDFLKIHSTENYMKLQERLQRAVWDSVPMKINDPLLANVFSEGDTTLLPIINNGSEISAQIRIERHIETAQWFPIGECSTLRCNISTHSSWSDIIVPKVKSLGLLVCQNA